MRRIIQFILLSTLFVALPLLAQSQPDPEPTIGTAERDDTPHPPPVEAPSLPPLDLFDMSAVTPEVFLPLISDDFMLPFEMQVLDLVNIERAKAGCGPVRADRALRQAAYLHSKDMGDNGYFSHTGRDGSSFSQRARRAGYTGSPRGENIAAGYTSPSSVMNGWMNSSGHRNNILNCNSNELGVGYYWVNKGYRHYWTQVFGRE